MSDFDVSRIVPSTRDLFGALATRRRGLALLPVCDGEGEGDAAADALRLDAIGVRALAHRAGGQAMQGAAIATSLPSLCVADLADAAACQHARFHGADGVCLSAFGALAKTAQSMRMLALGWATNADGAAALAAGGARGVLLCADADEVIRAAERLPALLIVADLRDPSEEKLRSMLGKVDAAVVPSEIHRRDIFAKLLDELDS